MTVVTTRPPEEMTLAELKARAKELGIESSQVEPIEATGEVPVKADWLREVLRAEESPMNFNSEWCEPAVHLVALFGEVPESEATVLGRKLAEKFASGTARNAELVDLREAVKATASILRDADQRDLATQFSNANYLVRRAERATRPATKTPAEA